MAGFGLSFNGIDRLRATINFSLAATKPESMTRLANQLGVLALREEADYFTTNRAPDGTPWKALSPVTESRRRKGKKSGRSNQILRDSGRLRLSVTPGSGGFASGATGAVRFAGPRGFMFGSSLNYATTHQFGRGKVRGLVREKFREGYRVRSYTRKDGVSVKAHTVGGHRVRFHWTTLAQIPKRPFVGFSQRYIERAMQIVSRTIIEGR